MQRVLFGLKDDWIEPVRERVDGARFETAFADLRDPKLTIAEFDAVVPLRLSDYAPLRKWDSPRANFLIPSDAAVGLLDDKVRCHSFLKANGFGDLLPAVFGDGNVVYPFIYKKHRDKSGIHSRVIDSADARAAFERGIDGNEYFKQEYVGGKVEFTTHILAVDGAVRFAANFAFSFDLDHFVRGVHFEPKSIDRVELCFLAEFAEILELLAYNGTCCINFKIAGGRPKIFEINPRIGGSMRLDLNSYLDAYVAAIAIRAAGAQPAA